MALREDDLWETCQNCNGTGNIEGYEPPDGWCCECEGRGKRLTSAGRMLRRFILDVMEEK